MTKQYVINLTEAEDKALSIIAIDQNEWIQNAIHERCRIAIEEIVGVEVQRKLAAGEPITGTKEDIVLAADIETAAEREARIKAEFEAMEQQG
jgi:hypothetical protein